MILSFHIDNQRCLLAFASLMKSGHLSKTPGLFGGADEPSFGNDYTLMTPGLEAAAPFSK